MKSRSRKTGSERVQVVIVHSAMVTALVAIVMLVQAFASIGQANNREVASSSVIFHVENLDELPSCEVLRSMKVEWVESDVSDEWSIDDLCEVQ